MMQINMGTKKGGARKGKPAGSRKAFDDTKDSKKKPSAFQHICYKVKNRCLICGCH